MSVVFPSSPTVGQQYTDATSNTKFYWTGTYWRGVFTQGSKGDKGDGGPIGVKGDKGDIGPKGESSGPTVISVPLDAGDITTPTVDAFGVSIDQVYDFMSPEGSIVPVDFGSITS